MAGLLKNAYSLRWFVIINGRQLLIAIHLFLYKSGSTFMPEKFSFIP